jgi:hypothetical protein
MDLSGRLSEKRDGEVLVLVSCMRGPFRLLRMPSEGLAFPSTEHHISNTACLSQNNRLMSKAVLHCPSITERMPFRVNTDNEGPQAPAWLRVADAR